jgi:hypothetical protein
VNTSFGGSIKDYQRANGNKPKLQVIHNQVSLGSISLITGEGDPTNLVTEFGQIDEYIPSNYLPGGLNSNLEILPEGLSCF